MIHFNVAIVVELSSCRCRGSALVEHHTTVNSPNVTRHSVSQPESCGEQASEATVWIRTTGRAATARPHVSLSLSHERCRMHSIMCTAHIKLTVCAWPFAVTAKKKHQIYFFSQRISCVSLFVPLTQGDNVRTTRVLRFHHFACSPVDFRTVRTLSLHTIDGPA